MQSAFKQKLQILRINIVNTYQQDTAYFWNNLAALISTILYTVTYIIFIRIIYANVQTVAGYTRDEMLLFALIGNFTFYLLYMWSWDNLDLLRTDVNRGNLDLLLTKPLPHLFYLSNRRITLLQILRQSIPTGILVILSINWHNLQFSPWNVVAGILIFICGILTFHILQFFMMLPVFWYGESGELMNLSYPMSDYDVPYEGFPSAMRITLTIILPILLCTALPASVMLGKSNATVMLGVSLLVTAAGLLLRRWGWNHALKNYTSASS